MIIARTQEHDSLTVDAFSVVRRIALKSCIKNKCVGLMNIICRTHSIFIITIKRWENNYDYNAGTKLPKTKNHLKNGNIDIWASFW